MADNDHEQGRESSRLTTTIPRPKNRRASDAGRSRLGDVEGGRWLDGGVILRPLRSTWLLGLAALVVAGAIGAALFGLPVRTWFDQDRELGDLDHELSELQQVNQDLRNEVNRLQTEDGIRDAARDELGVIDYGDTRRTMLDLPALPRDLPDGWPYSQFDAVLTIRAATEAPPTSMPGRAADGE